MTSHRYLQSHTGPGPPGGVGLSELQALTSIRINGQEFSAQDSAVVTIGRDATCHVVLNHPRVSRHHAELRAEADGWVFRDLGSTNGSFREDHQISEFLVTGHTRIYLGGTRDGAPIDVDVDIPELAASRGSPPAPQQIEPISPIPSSAGTPGDMSTAEGQLAPQRGVSGPPSKLGRLSAVHDAQGERIRIGRAADNDLVLGDDLRVSRHHAELLRIPGGAWEIVDERSANGTFVNGERVDRAQLHELDVISIGNHVYRLVRGTLEEYVDTGEAAFEALNLSVKTDDGRVILDDVSLYLEPSYLLAVVGPSGSGKTTLLNALTGFRPAQTGSVLFGGRNLYTSFEDLRRRIGYVPQDDILHPQLTVRRALQFAAELRFPPDVDAKTRMARIDEVLVELGLTERQGVRIEALSGGQRKRVSLALELLTKPSLLFLDEPTSGLDPGNERQVMALLRDLATGGRTVIVVTHSVQSLHLCNRVLFMAAGGRVAYYGPPDEGIEYFRACGVGEHFADVFTKLESDSGIDWDRRFRADSAFARYVGRPMSAESALRSSRPPQALPPPRLQPWGREFGILVRRYLSLIASDRRYLLLLLLQAPILGIVMALLFGPGRLSIAHGPEAMVLILALVIGITWLGVLNAIREIVKELPIYRRERSVGLSISGYIASKAAVLAGFTILQAILLVGIGLARQQVYIYQATSRGLAVVPNPAGALLGAPKLELIIDVAMAGLAAMALGLLVSAIAKNADKALTLVPILIVPQLVLAGGLFPVTAPILGQIKYLASAQWGMSAAASTIDLNQVRARVVLLGLVAEDPQLGIYCTFVQPFDPRCASFQMKFRSQQVGLWKHSGGVWFGDVAALAVLTVLGLVGAYWILHRRDLQVLSAGSARAGPLQPMLTRFRRPSQMAGAAR